MSGSVLRTAGTALIVIDPQVSFCDATGSMARQGRPIKALQQAAQRCDSLATVAREAGVPVIWTRMVFAPGYTDGGELTRTIRPNLARVGALERGSGDEELSSLVHPWPDDVVVDKNRFSALVGTSLENTLRERCIRRILLCGMTTSMCVESTVRDLGQRDFETFVIPDACADFDDSVHAASVAAMTFGYARALSADDACALLKGQPPT